MARGNGSQPKKPAADRLSDKASLKAEKLHAKAEKLHAKVDEISAKAKEQVDSLEQWAARLESMDVWMRAEPRQRQARFTRADLARTAIRIIDTEGVDALSMRRLAAELGAGTMTLYHYVQNKDELLTVVSDAVMAEVVLPEGYELPEDWQEAVVVVATRSRDSIKRHPWVFDLTGDMGMGPNSVKHMDQTLQAVAHLDAPLRTKLDVVAAVDEYVFGYCIQEREGWTDDHQREVVTTYVTDLVAGGGYPQLQKYLGELGADGLWDAFEHTGNDDARFERNLRRFLAGIAADL
jgi:AcrR family transcriptional regulator